MTPTITELVSRSLNDATFVKVFSASFVFYILISKIGGGIYDVILTNKERDNSSRIVFCSHFKTMIHHSLIIIPTYLTIYDSPAFKDIYTYFTIMSSSFYLFSIACELFIPETLFKKIIYIIHHIACGTIQFFVFSLGGMFPIISAFVTSVETGDALSNISWFSKQYQNKRCDQLATIAKTIVCPITKLIGTSTAMYIVYHQRAVVPISLYWFMISSTSFLILLSFVHMIQIWMNPIKSCTLNITNTTDMSKVEEETQPLIEV